FGEPLRVWLLGGYAPDQAALTRFFSLHYLLPFVIAGVVILHIWALHIPGSGNPTGVDVRDEKDTLPFHPFYTAKDGWFAAMVLLAYALVVYFAPNYLGHPDNYIPANPLSTPPHIVPEWYFWPFYAILRSFTVDFILPAKLWGVLAMFGSILLLFFLPWLDKSPVRSGSYRPMFKRFFWLLVVDVLILGYIGGAPINPFNVALGQIAAAYYFLHFLVILPLVSKYEQTLPLPTSISASVLHGEEQESAPAGVKTGKKKTTVAR
ncbi:MAG TPA: cytochrome b N-terminal domain-containing protein, partial [Sphingomicrobium sp.]|nr:cytochrome b N-terminal domain-containing protein [Sphingomicrobium sp.]